MRINLKQPKYVLPVIILPFVILFFYIYKSSDWGKQPNKTSASDPAHLQSGIADVSDQVKNKSIEDKLEAYRSQYKDGDGYTAVGTIGQEQLKGDEVPDLYNSREKRMLDSIDQLAKQKYNPGVPRAIHGAGSFRSASAFPDLRGRERPVAKDDYDQQMAAALAAISKTRDEPALTVKQTITKQKDPMDVFRQQMALVDSMSKANDPEYKEELRKNRRLEMAEKESKNKVRLTVSKLNGAPKTVFNTITVLGKESFIRAIVDQDMTSFAGSRLRIRLLDDMVAGKFIIKTGTYLYAMVSGFSGQRVNLTITTIMQDRHILPVKLEVYDTDGISGLYVPDSQFREFSKDLGSSAGEGISLQQQADGNNQLVMSLLSRMFQSTTNAVSKMIRSNKAKLKYNTQVFLIDPDELKADQQKY